MKANRILLPLILDECGFENRAHVRRVVEKCCGPQPPEYTEEQIRWWRLEEKMLEGVKAE